MTVWLVRAGSHGEYEDKFIQDKRIYLTWEGLKTNLAKLEWEEVIAELNRVYPDCKPKSISNWTGQLWSFVRRLEIGDWIVLPIKSQPVIQIGKITGKYVFDKSAPDPFFHSHTVEWIGEAIPRANFSDDILYSFGAFLTVCRIQRNNAEARLRAMHANGWKPESIRAVTETAAVADDEAETDLVALSQDQIARLIAAKFKGHNFTRLVEGILRATGYTTYLSPEGSDGGADILAGSGPLGFDSPRICVEVKSEDKAIDRPTVDKLLGAVSKFGADQGLFVSMNGYKGNVQKELAQSFFKIRLWSQKELLEQLFLHYDKLDENLKAELPLKRIWTIAHKDDE